MSDKTFNDEIRRAVNSTKLLSGISVAPYVRLPVATFKALHKAATIYIAEEDSRYEPNEELNATKG